MINDLDFDINKGELVSLIGPNGSGKSTIVNLLTGVYKPDAGTVTFDEGEIQGRPTHEVCRLGITRTFQIPKPFKKMTTLENVVIGYIFGRGNEKRRDIANEKAKEILVQVGLSDQSNVLAQFLTPSQCRRLEIARAMAASPKLLLLDEVMAGFSVAESEDMMALIRKIRDSGVTILMIEHVIRVVMALSERVIVINGGQKICEGLPSEVANDVEVVTAYLGRRAAGR